MNDATKRPMTKATDDDIVSLVPADRMAPKFRRRIANQRLKTDGNGCCPCGGKLETARDAAMAELPKKAPALAEASLLLREHGKETCKTSAPRCGECPVTGACAWYRARAPKAMRQL